VNAIESERGGPPATLASFKTMCNFHTFSVIKFGKMRIYILDVADLPSLVGGKGLVQLYSQWHNYVAYGGPNIVKIAYER
jgi:hypothetical protein